MPNTSTTNNIKVLLSRRTHGTRDLANTIAEVTDTGFDGMELALSSLGVVFGGRIIASELRQLVKITETSNAHFTLHAPLSLNFLDADHIHSHIAVGRACIDVAEAIGATTVVLHPGWVHPSELAEHRTILMETECQHLHELAIYAKNRGTKIALENMPMLPKDKADKLTTYGLIPNDIAQQAKNIDLPSMTTCLDVSHAAIAATALSQNLQNQIHSMAPHIGHIHLHDSCAQPGNLLSWVPEDNLTFGYGDMHLPLGWGTLDFESLLKNLPVQKDTSITLEILDPLQMPASLQESLEKARQIAALFNVLS